MCANADNEAEGDKLLCNSFTMVASTGRNKSEGDKLFRGIHRYP